MTDTTVTLKTYVTVAEVARRLALSKMTVYRMCALGQITSIRIGSGRGNIRISEAAYDAYVSGLTGPAPAPPAPAPHIPGQLEILPAETRPGPPF